MSFAHAQLLNKGYICSLSFLIDRWIYRFWKYASSVLTRRPSPRRPWLQVRWGVRRTEQESWPPLLSSGSGHLTGDCPASSSLLPLSAVDSRCSDLPSVPAVFAITPRTGEEELVWRAASTDNRLSSSRRTTAPESTRRFPSHCVWPGAEASRHWSLLAEPNPSRSQKFVEIVSEKPFQPCWLSFSHQGVIWLHLEIRVCPTFQVESGLQCQSSHWIFANKAYST